MYWLAKMAPFGQEGFRGVHMHLQDACRAI